MNTIETELINSRTINGKSFPEALHQSLIAHKIITNPRVIKCGTYYSKERGHFRFRIQCNNQKECPVCRTRVADKRKRQLLKEQMDCLKEDGFVYMVTGTLRHRKQDSLKLLQGKLRDSVKRLKNDRGWRKLRQRDMVFHKTVYETVYGEKNGYHPHVMFLFGTKDQNLNKTEIKETLNPYWRTYTGANLDVLKIDSIVTTYPYKDWDYNLRSIFKKMNDEMKERFEKPTLEIMLLCYDHLPDSSSLPLPKSTVIKVLKEMNQNQSYYLGR